MKNTTNMIRYNKPHKKAEEDYGMDIYSEECVEQLISDDSISNAEEGFMQGYLAAACV